MPGAATRTTPQGSGTGRPLLISDAAYLVQTSPVIRGGEAKGPVGRLKFVFCAASARVSDAEGIDPDTEGTMRRLRLLSVLTAVVALLCDCATQVMSTALVSAQATRPQAVPPAPAGWTTVFKDDSGPRRAAPSAKNWFYDIGTGFGTGEIEHDHRRRGTCSRTVNGRPETEGDRVWRELDVRADRKHAR